MSESPFAAVPSSAALREQAAAAIAEADRRDRAVAALEREAREARKPKMPELDENDVAFVAFTKYLSGREYAYAAVGWRVGRSVRWSVTGSQDGVDGRFNWPGLLAWVGEANWPSLRVLTPGEPMVAPGEEPPVLERLGKYGAVLGTSDPSAPDPHLGGPGGYSGSRFARGSIVGPYEG